MSVHESPSKKVAGAGERLVFRLQLRVYGFRCQSSGVERKESQTSSETSCMCEADSQQTHRRKGAKDPTRESETPEITGEDSIRTTLAG